AARQGQAPLHGHTGVVECHHRPATHARGQFMQAWLPYMGLAIIDQQHILFALPGKADGEFQAAGTTADNDQAMRAFCHCASCESVWFERELARLSSARAYHPCYA